MIKCVDLSPLPDGIEIKDLVNQMQDDQTKYNECKARHNKLVDLIFKRVQSN